MVFEAQVESFATILQQMVPPGKEGLEIVDFGCGTGNLLLPLASQFPMHNFIGVDMKPEAIRILAQRADDAGLQNVTAKASG